jgi:RsmE family RNA methyltransferase
MNIILFEAHEAACGFLPRNDRRFEHLLSVLRACPGDRFIAGILNGGTGFAEILSISAEGLFFRFTAEVPPLALLPVDMIIGLPRPLVTGRLIKDLAALGIRRLCFVRAGLSEKSYMSGSLWRKGEYRRHLLDGLQQSGTSLMPEVRLHESFDDCLARFPRVSGGGDCCRCVLDLRGKMSLRDVFPGKASVLAIGPERGWTEAELEKFEGAGFLSCAMGPRILRTEAAALAAASVMLSRMGLM